MPYRQRAVSKIKGQRKLKPSNPTAKFTLTKVYQLRKPSAGTDNCLVLDVDVSTPFQPLTARSGTWTPNDTVNEPFGIGSDIYSHFNHLVVLGCKVSASIRDAPDFTAASGESLSTGQLSLVRASAPNMIAGTATASDIKVLYGHKTKGFQLSPRMTDSTVSANVLTKNAYCSLGYSARKTWKANPLSVDSLRVVNQSGSSNKCSDTTHINVCVLPQMDVHTDFLLPMQCVVKLEYIICFMEPNRIQSVPLPFIPAKKKQSSPITDYTSKLQLNWKQLAQLAGTLGTIQHMAGRRRAADFAARRGIRN